MTSGAHPLLVPTIDLMRRPGTQKHVTATVHLSGLVVAETVVPDDAAISVDVAIESQSTSVVADATISAPWHAECRRCLIPIDRVLDLASREVFDRKSIDGESYPLGDDYLDLEPMVRDLILLELPIAPVCRDDCAGLCPTCGANHNEVSCDCELDRPASPWDALRALELPDEPDNPPG
jgi:uncharacterized protein